MSADPTPLLDVIAPAWTATLALPIERIETPDQTAPEVSSFVQIIGDWQGLVVLSCSRSMAEKVTAAMFGLTPAELAPEMIQDALGEMANILGGVVKAGIPGTKGLSLPTVVQGDGHLVFVPDMKLVDNYNFDCGGEVVSVKLCEHISSARQVLISRLNANKEAA